ncbi:hypothetical protein LTR95_019200 [Oleoguttula sp. CCFEE 5521]
MPIDVTQYSADAFNGLHDFPEALGRFDGINGDDLANTTMKDLFRRHGVESIFGLQLLHKHNTLAHGERLTDVRGTSNPLTFDVGGKPSIWGFDSGTNQVVPLEFSIDAEDIEWQAPAIQQFLHAFQATLLAEGAFRVLGLAQYPGDGYPGRVEFTVGRSNVNLRPDEP